MIADVKTCVTCNLGKQKDSSQQAFNILKRHNCICFRREGSSCTNTVIGEEVWPPFSPSFLLAFFLSHLCVQYFSAFAVVASQSNKLPKRMNGNQKMPQLL